MEKKFKLIVLDIDGTLLDNDSKISFNTANSIKKIKEHGIEPTFATGRLFPDARYYADILQIFQPMILLHGAIVQSPDGKVIKGFPLSHEIIRELINFARNKKVAFQLYQKDSLLIEKRTFWHNQYLKYSPGKPKVFCFKDIWKNFEKEIYQFAFFGANEDILILRELVKEHFKESISIQFSHPNLLEIAAPNISKGAALIELADIMNISLKNIITVGDYENDLEMLQLAGLGVAMGNAPQKVKNVANFITESNSKDGLAIFIEHLLACNYKSELEK